MTDDDGSGEASLERDGWLLADAEDRFAAADRVYWLPELADRVSIAVGDLVKLIFRILQTAEDEAEAAHYEWMWVEVETVADGRYCGVLTNDPCKPGRTTPGMAVRFRPEHVVDILKPDGWRASEGEDVLKCATHGHSDTTWVCEHLSHGATGVGFHTGEPPWPGNRRPDAWCDACDTIIRECGSWDAAAEQGREPKISLLCGGCYDRCRERNVRAPGTA